MTDARKQPHGGGAGGAPLEWEPVIGLEMHVELDTQTKMFCGCAVARGDAPNLHTCPVCLAHPGALPVVNRRAVEYATRIALALNCTVRRRCIFHRKNYFYPDLPKAYQISQHDEPLATGGWFDYWVGGEKLRCRINRVHMEEDAAKLVHAGGETGRIAGSDYSLVDFNRSGTPLIEIVTEPEIPSPEAAREFLQQLRVTVAELGVSECNMEEGQVRWDANMSVRRVGSDALGTRTELKNMNSFRFLQQALEAELPRQIGMLEAGARIEQETRIVAGIVDARLAARRHLQRGDYHSARTNLESALARGAATGAEIRLAAAGFIISLLVSLAAIHFCLRFFRTRTLRPFAAYLAAAGAAVVALAFFR